MLVLSYTTQTLSMNRDEDNLSIVIMVVMGDNFIAYNSVINMN